MENIDRRKRARIYKDLKLEFSDAEIKNLGSIDLSSLGLRFRAEDKIPVFKKLSIKLDLSDEEGDSDIIECQAVVIRCEKSKKAKGYQITLFFHNLKKSEKKKLQSYIENIKNKGVDDV